MPSSRQLIEAEITEKRMLSSFEQIKILARRKTKGRVVFNDKLNYAEITPQDAQTILAVWKTKSLNDKAKIERQVGRDETSFKRILAWARKGVRYESADARFEYEGALIRYGGGGDF